MKWAHHFIIGEIPLLKKSSEMSILLCNDKYLAQTEYTTGNHLSRLKKKSASL